MPSIDWRPIARIATLGAVIAGLASCAGVRTETASAVLQRADVAMGGVGLRNIAFAGTGSGASFGQAFQPGMAWPAITYSHLSRVADYENAALREDAARSRAEPAGGGAIPLMGQGEQRTTGMMRGSWAWNMAGPAPVASPVALAGRVHDLWTTPHGVVKAALAHDARLSTRNDGGRALNAVSFAVPGRFRATALINSDGLVEQIESTLPHPVTGDTASVIQFSDYRDVAGPNSISPDALLKSGRRATVIGVSGKRSFSDGERVVEVYAMEGSPHAQGFHMVYLPREKILIQADAFTPAAPNSAPPARPNDLHVNLVQNIERLGLQVERILPLHGRMVPMTELLAMVGRKG